LFFDFIRKRRDSDAVYAVYRSIVAQSRQPVFYAEWGVPDTVTGRFDMISLHLALLFRRFAGESDAAREFSQNVFDLFFKDMDRSLREMGAGDLAVPKKIKTMSTLFYGVCDKLTRALDANDVAAMQAMLDRNIYGEQPAPGAAPLAAYLMEEYARLAGQPVADIMAGRLTMGEQRA
jgi:cytochrome b pre-mRNA-processing protein 3